MNIENINIMGYHVSIGSSEDIINGAGKVVATINPHSFLIARSDLEFSTALHNSDYLIPDGAGIVIAAQYLLGAKIRRHCGPDLLEVAIKSAYERKEKVFFMGSSQRVLCLIAEKINAEYPGIDVSFHSPSFTERLSCEESEKIIEKINESGATHVFVGMTAPKQEKWVEEYKSKINCEKIYSIGAAFDWYCGSVRRPPKLFEDLHLGWLARAFIEPRVWRRAVLTPVQFLREMIFYNSQ